MSASPTECLSTAYSSSPPAPCMPTFFDAKAPAPVSENSAAGGRGGDPESCAGRNLAELQDDSDERLLALDKINLRSKPGEFLVRGWAFGVREVDAAAFDRRAAYRRRRARC